MTCSYNPKSGKVETSRSLELLGQPAQPSSRPMGNEGQEHLNANTRGHPLPQVLAQTLVDTHTEKETLVLAPQFQKLQSVVSGPIALESMMRYFIMAAHLLGNESKRQKRDTINDLISSPCAPPPKWSVACLWNKPSAALGSSRNSQDPNTNRQDPRDQSGQGTHSFRFQYMPAHRSVPHTFMNTEAKMSKYQQMSYKVSEAFLHVTMEGFLGCSDG